MEIDAVPKWAYVQAPHREWTARWNASMGGYSERAGSRVRRLEIPTGHDVLILSFGKKLQVRSVTSRSTPTLRGNFIGGFACGPQIVEHAGTQECVEIMIPPRATATLFPNSYAEWNRSVVDLVDLWGHEVTGLSEQIGEEADWLKRFEAVEHFLASKFSESRGEVRSELLWAWEQIAVCRGDISIRALAKAIGWSHRHFAVRFQSAFGISPKTTARHLRFAKAMNVLLSPDTRPLSDIAYQFGFSDQSHFCREIRELSGSHPSALRSTRFPELPGIPADVLSA